MTADARERDARARWVAQTDFERPVALEAGAGTGKTAALVARVVAWCLGPGWERARASASGVAPDVASGVAPDVASGVAPDVASGVAPGVESDVASGVAPGVESDAEPEQRAVRVLRRVAAITFTEAAAAEMAERVGQAFAALESGQAPVGLDVCALSDPPAERSARAAALRTGLDQLRVQTIHSFCRRLLAEHPLEAGLHPRFAVDADESGQKAVVREVLEAALPALFETSEALLELVRAGETPGDLEAALLFLVGEGVSPAALGRDPLADERVKELIGRARPPIDAFVALEGGRLVALGSRAPLVSSLVAGLAQLGERLRDCEPTLEGLEVLLAWLRECDFSDSDLQKWEDRLKQWETKRSFGKSADRAVGEDLEGLVERACAVRPVLRHLRRVDVARLRAVREVLLPLHAEVFRSMRARGIETFRALLHDARSLLASDAGVRRRVRLGIDQLLVDEFQDTDPVQCDIVRWLAFDGPVEERPGLFLVGDPKQSIYGWRNADLAAYEDFVEQLREEGGRVECLVVNYRSTQPILDEVSRLFAPVMLEEPRVQPPFVELLTPPDAEDAAPGAGRAPVEHWVSWGWDRDVQEPRKTSVPEGNALEAAALAADVAALHAAGTPWSRIGLLFRAGTAVETCLAALRRAEVPFAMKGDRSYFARREIIEACALVRCVLDAHDQLALLTLLRSSVVGVPDAALVPLWAGELPRCMAELNGNDAERLASLAVLVAQAQAQVPGDIPGIARIAGWADNLLDAARALGTLRAAFETDAADVFVEKLRGLFLFEVTESARYPGAYRLANLDRFFRDLSRALRDGEGDPQAVLRDLREDVAQRREAEEGRPREAIEDAVQVMTIHKAKGLDFDHVYVLQLHRGQGSQPSPRAEEIEGQLEVEFLGARTLGYDAVEVRHARVARAERVRTLYVAATRARRRLVLAGVHPEMAGSRSSESHVALLAHRKGGRPDLVDEMQRVAADAGEHVDAAGVRWRFPALFSETAPDRSRPRKPLHDPKAVSRMSEALAARRANAAATRERPLRAAVSASAHEAQLERVRERGAVDEGREDDRGEASPMAGPRAAAAVGTAVHRVFEFLDLDADLEDGLAAAAADLERRLDPALAPGERVIALGRAHALLDAFARGPLLARLQEIAPHVIARELSVLLPPDPDRSDGPVGFLAGVVDLLYRDPASGVTVVADYKTDRIAGEAEIGEKAERYRTQGEAYVRGIQGALGLLEPPRFELWFLDASEIRGISL